MATKSWSDVLASVGNAGTPSSRSTNPTLDFLQKKWEPFAPRNGSSGGSGGLTTSEYADSINQYMKAKQMAEQLGTDSKGKGPDGLLDWAAHLIRLPGAAVFELGSNLSKIAGGNEQDIGDLGDVWNRVWNEQPGFGTTEALKMRDSDAWWQTALKGGAAFALDTVTDPLTWTSAGATRGASSIAGELGDDVFRAGVDAIAKNFGEDAAISGIDAMAKAGFGQAADDAIRMSAKGADNVVADVADDLLGKAASSGESALSNLSQDVTRFADDAANAAGPNWDVLGRAQNSFKSGLEAAYKSRGARGGQQYLIDTFGEQVGKQLWETMPEALKGGIRINNPLGFLMKNEYGLADPLLRIDAGGRIASAAENLGITRAMEAAREVTRKVPGAKWLGVHLGGRFGEQKWAATENAIKAWSEKDGVLRASKLMSSFGELNGLKDAYRAHAKAMEIFGKDAAATAADMARFLSEDGIAEAEAKTYAREFLADSAKMASGPSNMNNVNEVAGFNVAQTMRDFYTRHGEMLTDIDALDPNQFMRMTETDYMPRVLTEEGKKTLRKQMKETASNSVGDTSATKSRDDLWARWARDPETGQRKIVGWLTPSEVNEQVGYRMFEDDPVKAWAKYVANTQRTVSAYTLRNALVERGLLKDATTLFVSASVPRREKLSDAAYRLFNTADSARKVRQRGSDLFEDMAAHYNGVADDLQSQLDNLLTGTEAKAQRAASADARRAERAGGKASQQRAEEAASKATKLRDQHAKKVQDLADAKEELAELRKQQASARQRATKAEKRGAENAEALRKASQKAEQRVTKAEKRIADLEAKVPSLDERATKAATQAEEAAQRAAREAESIAARRAAEDATSKTLRSTQIKAAREAVREARRLAKQFADASKAMQEEITILAGTREGLEALLDPENLPRDPQALADHFTALIDLVGGAAATGKASSRTSRLSTIDEALARNDLPAGVRQSLRDLQDKLANEKAYASAGSLRNDVFENTPPRVTEVGQQLKDLGWNQVGVDAARDTSIPRKAFEDLWGPEAVRSFLETTYRVKSGDTGQFQRFISDVFEPMMSLFRQTATVGRGPGFALRNFYGGMWQNFAAGVSPQDMLIGIKYSWMLRQADKWATERLVAEVGERGARFALRRRDELIEQYFEKEGAKVLVRGRSMLDLHKAMEAERVLYNNRTFNIMSKDATEFGVSDMSDSLAGRGQRTLFDVPRSERKAWQRVVDFPVNNKTSRRWIDFNSRFNDSIENALRAGAFVNGYRRFGDDGAARLFATALHFDYSDLSEFERRFMRNLIPFYTWMRNNIPLQAWFLLHQPGRVNMLLRAQDTMKQVMGDKESDGLMPQWMKSSRFFETSIGMGPGKLAIGLESPMMDVNKYFNAPSTLNPGEAFGMINLDAFLSNLNPIMRSGVEAYTGRSTVTGKEFRGAVETPLWLGGGKLNPLLELIPGVETGTTEDGKAGINEVTLNTLRSVLPFLSQGDRLVPTTDDAVSKLPSTLGSNVLGLPLQVVTPNQRKGVLSDYTKRIQKGIDAYYAEKGVSKEWVTLMKQKGYTEAQIALLINNGYGREAPSKKQATVKSPLRLN